MATFGIAIESRVITSHIFEENCIIVVMEALHDERASLLLDENFVDFNLVKKLLSREFIGVRDFHNNTTLNLKDGRNPP